MDKKSDQSGSHLRAFITGKISLIKVIMYVVAQIAGAVVGALLLAAAIPEAAQGNRGAHGLGPGVTVAAV